MNRHSLKLAYPRGKYVPELDGVRGLAILLVMLYHCFPVPLTGIGWIGVDLFFVLSGFLITGILIDSKGGRKYYVNFIGRRILRIFPLYYMVLFIILFLIPTLLGPKLPSHFTFYTNNQGWFWSYLQNWLYSFRGFPENHLLVHFWSLGVEEQFYLVWPLIILITPNRYLLKVSLSLCVVAILFRLLPLEWFHFSATYRYMATVSRMDALLIGAIIAQLIRKNMRMLEKISVPLGIVGLITFIIGVTLSGSQSFMHVAAFYTAIDLFMGMLIVLSFSHLRRFRKIMRYPVLTFLGKYSYGLYVYHYIIYVLLIYFIRHSSIVHFTNYLQRVLVIGVITIVLAIGISFLSYQFFEIYFLKLKSYFRGPRRIEEPKGLKRPANVAY